jgi:hypothetical protein
MRPLPVLIDPTSSLKLSLELESLVSSKTSEAAVSSSNVPLTSGLEKDILWPSASLYCWARLEKGDYENAKYRFHRAYQLKSNDYMTFFALTTVYIYDCMENQIDCDIAEDLLNKLELSFASKSEVIELHTKYNDFLKAKKYK